MTKPPVLAVLVFYAFAALLSLVTGVSAQEVAVPTEPGLVQQIINALAPAIVAGASVVALFIVNGAAKFVKEKFGLDIEQDHRNALHSALVSGVRIALVKLGWVPGTDVPPAALTMAVAHVQRSVPDAIKSLHPSETVLLDLAKSKVPEVAAEIAASGPEAVKMAPSNGQ